jgi:hypothetical protein
MKSLPRLAGALLSLLAPLEARANEFTFQEEIDAALAHDLNGDGTKELIAQSGRKLCIYFYKEPRGYSLAEERQTQFTLPEDVGIYAFGDVDGKPGPEIVGLSGSGVRAWSLVGNTVAPQAQEVLALATALEGTILEKPVPRDFLADLDADGDLDLVVPRRGFMALYAQAAPGEFELAQKLPVEIETTMSMGGGAFQSAVARGLAFPRFWLQDFDGDRRPDFVLFRGAVMQVHRGVAGGLFSHEAARAFNFDKFVKTKRRRRQMYDFFGAPSMELGQADGDGRADVAIMLRGKGRVGVFRAAGEKPYTEGQVVALSGWTFRREGLPMWRDLDRDGRDDLILLNIPKLGLWDILEIFFSRKIEVKIYFYRARPDGTYANEADYELSVTVPLIMSVTRDMQRLETPFLITFGDVNGDGRDDLVLKEADDRLDVRLGTPEGLFHKGTDRQIRVKDTRGMGSAPPLVADLNGDGTDDVVLHSEDFEQRVYVLEVIRMKRE